MSRHYDRVLRSVLGPRPDDIRDGGYQQFCEETMSEGKLELLIEPQPGVSLEALRQSSTINLLHAYEKSTYLDDYLWR